MAPCLSANQPNYVSLFVLSLTTRIHETIKQLLLVAATLKLLIEIQNTTSWIHIIITHTHKLLDTITAQILFQYLKHKSKNRINLHVNNNELKYKFSSIT